MCGKTEQISLVRNKDAVRYSRRSLSWIDSDCCMTILLRQLREELLAWERTPWHWSKQAEFRPSWLFHKGCLSLHSWQTAILSMLAYWTQHIGPSPVSISIHVRISFSCSMKFFQLKTSLGLALGESWPLLAQPPKNTDVHKGMLPWEGLPRQTCINHLRRNKDVNSWIKFRLSYDKSFAPALVGASAMGTNTMALIQIS